MRYSLLSRFRGCLIGAVLGGIYGDQSELAVWGKMAVLGAESLIELGRFDLDNWRQRFYSEFPNLNEVNTAPGVLEKPSFNSFSQERLDAMNYSTQGALIVTLPLALFYHENEITLRQHLLSLLKIWRDEPVVRDGVLAIGYAIAQSLQEKLNPSTLIPKTITFLGESPSQLAQELAQVQILLEQGSGLERAVEMHRQTQPSSSIALTFYCFLSTLEDWRLSTLRAAQTGEQTQIMTAITGALSGAYNSTSGIPAPLRMVLSRPTEPLTAWGMTTAAQMLELADNLLAIWSGAYDQAQQLNTLTPVAAIAAPLMRLRRRSEE